MARQRLLLKAPIKEALIDIQYDPIANMDPIDNFIATIADRYGKKVDLLQASFGVTAGGLGVIPGPQTGNAIIGRRVDSVGAPYVLQCRRNAFALSRLYPYENWERTRDEAKGLWSGFVELAQIRAVRRIAVRYINELVLPLPITDYADYLASPPDIPKALPQALSSFLTRMVIPDEAAQCISIVTQANDGIIANKQSGQSTTVFMDIEVFRDINCDATGEEMWGFLDGLRDQKNRMFFEHITERTAEMFE